MQVIPSNEKACEILDRLSQGGYILIVEYWQQLPDGQIVKSRAKQAAHLERKGIERMTKALDELRNSVAAAERMILARTETRVDGDDQVRGIREQLPGGALAAAAT